jgi:hypothetical protein
VTISGNCRPCTSEANKQFRDLSSWFAVANTARNRQQTTDTRTTDSRQQTTARLVHRDHLCRHGRHTDPVSNDRNPFTPDFAEPRSEP